MKVIDFISLFNSHTKILVRRAFGDDDKRQFFGEICNFPENHQYANRKIIMVSPYQSNGCGDVPTIEEADSLDIAVGDFDEGKKFYPLGAFEDRVQEEVLTV